LIRLKVLDIHTLQLKFSFTQIFAAAINLFFV